MVEKKRENDFLGMSSYIYAYFFWPFMRCFVYTISTSNANYAIPSLAYSLLRCLLQMVGEWVTVIIYQNYQYLLVYLIF